MRTAIFFVGVTISLLTTAHTASAQQSPAIQAAPVNTHLQTSTPQAPKFYAKPNATPHKALPAKRTVKVIREVVPGQGKKVLYVSKGRVIQSAKFAANDITTYRAHQGNTKTPNLFRD